MFYMFFLFFLLLRRKLDFFCEIHQFFYLLFQSVVSLGFFFSVEVFVMFDWGSSFILCGELFMRFLLDSLIIFS